MYFSNAHHGHHGSIFNLEWGVATPPTIEMKWVGFKVRDFKRLKGLK
jgi:hypothetical protein